MPHLQRSVSLPLLTFYGIGTILGAGVYVLVGKIASYALMYTPLAFLLAAIVAAFTAMSYAELASRFPLSAGAALYVQQGFKRKWLSGIVGWCVVFTGIISAATLANGFAHYVNLFLPLPRWLEITALIVTLGAIAIWGIKESMIFLSIITLIEISGLLLVVFIAGDSLKNLPQHWQELFPPFKLTIWSGIVTGTFIAFYAYIGFEDMVNLAEEVQNPQRNLPYGIFSAVIISTLLYILVALVAILALPMNQLASSNAPLALIISHQGYSSALIGIIGLIAVINSALAQIIMGSRLIYGMGHQGMAPQWLSYVAATTKTPIYSTLLVTLIILFFALLFPLETLAKSTSFVILLVFSLVNLSLVVIKARKIKNEGVITYPIIIPIVGTILTLGLLVMQTLA